MKSLDERVGELTRTLRRLNTGTVVGSSVLPQTPAKRPGASVYRKSAADAAPRWATLVVAAHTTSDDGKAAADFVCAGSNDYATIQDALDRLVDSSRTPKRAGKIVLLEGDYIMGAGTPSIAPGSDRGITVEGMGWGTFLNVSSGQSAFAIDGAKARISSMSLYGGGGAGDGVQFTAPPDEGATIDNVLFIGADVVWVDDGNANTGYYLRFLNNTFNGGTIDIEMVDNHFFQMLVQGNIGLGLKVVGAGSNFLGVANNQFSDDVWIEGLNYLALGPNTANDANVDLTVKTIFDYVACGNVGFRSYTESGITNKSAAANFPAI